MGGNIRGARYLSSPIDGASLGHPGALDIKVRIPGYLAKLARYSRMGGVWRRFSHRPHAEHRIVWIGATYDPEMFTGEIRDLALSWFSLAPLIRL